MRTDAPASLAPCGAHPPAPAPAPRRPFGEALRRAAREPRTPRAGLAAGREEPGAAGAPALAVPDARPGSALPAQPASPAGPAAAPPAAGAAAVERARLAVDGLALRDRGALELRFGAEAVRLEATPAGVEVRVDAGPRAVHGVLDPAALADAVRARGVPVARAEARAGSERREGSGRRGR